MKMPFCPALNFGKKYLERSALVGLRGCCHISMVIQRYLFYNGKSNARTGCIFFVFQSFKYIKYLVGMLLFKANSLVGKSDAVIGVMVFKRKFCGQHLF